MLSFNKAHLRPIPGHRMYMPIYIFKKNDRYLTLPYQNSHVFITTNNHLIAENIGEIYKSNIIKHPILVARSLSEHLALDMVLLINTYCELSSKEQVWDIYYSTSQKQPASIFRSMLLEYNINDDL